MYPATWEVHGNLQKKKLPLAIFNALSLLTQPTQVFKWYKQEAHASWINLFHPSSFFSRIHHCTSFFIFYFKNMRNPKRWHDRLLNHYNYYFLHFFLIMLSWESDRHFVFWIVTFFELVFFKIFFQNHDYIDMELVEVPSLSCIKVGLLTYLMLMEEVIT